MGCDIHMLAERKIKYDGKEEWAVVQTFGIVHDKGFVRTKLNNDYAYYMVENRSYDYFGALTKGEVRGSEDDGLGAHCRGFPKDASLLAKAIYADWEGDAHSESWLTADEFVPVYIKYVLPHEEAAKLMAERMSGDGYTWQKIVEEHFNIGIGAYTPPEDIRFVFWFDN